MENGNGDIWDSGSSISRSEREERGAIAEGSLMGRHHPDYGLEIGCLTDTAPDCICGGNSGMTCDNDTPS